MVYGLVVCFLLAVGLLVALSCAAGSPVTGLDDGHLRPCPPRPNCVCSEGGKESAAWAEPLHFKGTAEAAWRKLRQVVQDAGGAIREDKGAYLWATFQTGVFRFVDDMEFRMAAAESVIHVRSASRVGYWDLGVNRKRIEKLRAQFGGTTK